MKQLQVKLQNSRTIEDAIKYLEQLKVNINVKAKEWIDRLMTEGIDVAMENEGQYAGMIVFERKFKETEDGFDAVLIATDGQKVVREWDYYGETVTVEVSPLLMAEFGSGWLANVIDNIDGVGQGTFPGQTHAFDPLGWWWKDKTGWHHSYGEAPTYPMHKAYEAMLLEVDRIGKEVFKNV